MKKKVSLSVVIMFALTVILSPAWSAPSDYYGVYTGNYTGDDHGVWVAYFNSTGVAWLSYSTDDGYGDGGYGSFGVEGASSIDFSAWNMDGDTYGNGTIQSDGSVTGSWINYWPVPDETGTFDGNMILSCSQQGDYSGTFSGDGSGTWKMSIQSNGHITGTITDSEGTYSYEGGINPDSGYFLVIGTTMDGDFVVYGQINGSGDVSGGWHTADDTYDGSISGSADGSSGGGSGSGGGGGCFLSMLAP
jgi:hypothetical protein